MENKKPENPNVFPITTNEIVNGMVKINEGITLRDYFANSAMQGHLASEYGAGVDCDKEGKEYLAKSFYDMADAMLKQRCL